MRHHDWTFHKTLCTSLSGGYNCTLAAERFADSAMVKVAPVAIATTAAGQDTSHDTYQRLVDLRLQLAALRMRRGKTRTLGGKGNVLTARETETISTWWAVVLLVFAPSKLIAHCIDHAIRSQPDPLDSERKTKLRGEFDTQFHKSVYVIRSSLFASFAVVAGAIVAAFVTGAALRALGVVKSNELYAWLQYGGIGVLLWATLARVDQVAIETWDGGTLPERIDLWLFRWLYIAGSYPLALSVAW
jgi:hypothetical protein